MDWLGLDIGGANLKAADGRGWARTDPFLLWREPHRLADALVELTDQAPRCDGWAVTMSGELCDCFRTKTEGVQQILSAVDRAVGGRELLVYCVEGHTVSIDEARRAPQLVAAGNWHALAKFAGRFVVTGAGLLLDIGSTTTDVVPILAGAPCPRGTCDTDRLLCSELIYSGVGRTPICAITNSLPWRGRVCPVTAEFFATSADAYVTLGDLPEQPHDATTADGRPRTIEFARERLARMICADSASFGAADALAAAAHVRATQIAQISGAIGRVIATGHATTRFIVSGAGEFLARRVIDTMFPGAPVVALSEELGSDASRCAPAHALAVLARENVSA